ncbi:probable mediator of RNA polymerase II transcription subunit 26b [Syzygium oleosum]|uniref:probable mediator of RNA polymerase II transcription subunit 26b n=1 Tax=Syzygium oleosum TaxID=219896 RepID=UPI0024B9EA9E|nr:probable mediator of RNA polymerase II transcription subunit 26b [Syzygium oleosum]
MMGESIDVWREFFRTTGTDVFEFIDKAITIAALDWPEDFPLRRGRIAERLLSRETTREGGDCAASSRESKANRGQGNAASNAVSIEYRHGEAEAFSGHIKDTSQVVCEVLRIKQVLDNSRHESDSVLLESLRRLRSMTITLDTLKKTKIGISVNNLRRNRGSNQIAQLAHDITMGWKAMVKEIYRGTEDVAGPCNIRDGTTSSVKNQKNIRKPGQEQYDFNQAGSLANRNRRQKLKRRQCVVKPNTSTNANSRTIPPSEIASWKFEKERMLQLQNSNGSVAGGKRPLACQRDKIKSSNKVVAEMNHEATRRKRRRIVQVLDLCDHPKMAASRKAP